MIPHALFSSCAALVLIAAAAETRASTVAPATLWQLVDEAELIVLADVRSIGDLVIVDPGGSEAHLWVREVWKGSSHRRLVVRLDRRADGRPATRRLAVGGPVLAFLKRERGAWRPVARSFGTRSPAIEELPQLRQLVTRAIVMQGEGRMIPEQRVDWLVDVAVTRTFRWDGLYELAAPAQWGGPASPSPRSCDLGRSLDAAQRKRLAAAFLDAPVYDGTLGMLLRLVRPVKDESLDRVALAAFQNLREMPVDPVDDLMLLEVLLRLDIPDAAARVARVTASDDERAQLDALWFSLTRDHALPDVAPLPRATHSHS